MLPRGTAPQACGTPGCGRCVAAGSFTRAATQLRRAADVRNPRLAETTRRLDSALMIMTVLCPFLLDTKRLPQFGPTLVSKSEEPRVDSRTSPATGLSPREGTALLHPGAKLSASRRSTAASSPIPLIKPNSADANSGGPISRHSGRVANRPVAVQSPGMCTDPGSSWQAPLLRRGEEPSWRHVVRKRQRGLPRALAPTTYASERFDWCILGNWFL